MFRLGALYFFFLLNIFISKDYELDLLITIATQANKSFKGLTMDTLGIPKENAKDIALTRSQKVTPRVNKDLHCHKAVGRM